ncbi:MAG: Hint domain-containing protein [Nitrososphaerota archaeon]
MMLQKPEKASYNKLNRRQVLEILGIGMGALAIGGCTSKLFKHDLSSSSQLEPLATSTSSLFWRTIQASKNLDREYLRERSRKLKSIAKQLKRGQGNPTELAIEVRQTGYEIISHWTERGVLQALDTDLVEILTITPESLVLPPPIVQYRGKQLQFELELSDNDILGLGWEKQYNWDKDRLLKAVRQEGTEMLWQRWLVGIFNQAQPPSSVYSRFVTLDGGLLALLLLGVLLLVAGCEGPSDGTGQLGSSVPYEPPEPSPNGGCCALGTLVVTAEGLRPIEQIQLGQHVCTFDIMSGDIAVRKVVKTSVTWAEEILLLNLGTEKIRCTPLHQFTRGNGSMLKISVAEIKF